jgi:hypothetical protein
MRCTVKKTVETIVASENDYCIGLKGNQPTLLRQARHCAETQPPLSTRVALPDTSHGRYVERTVHVFAAPPEATQAWEGLAAFAQVKRRGVRDGKPFQTESWFILSRVLPEYRVAELIQDHRGASENRVHWVKDVVQGEDNSLITASGPATFMAFLRSWAITALRKAGYDSITRAFRLVGHDIPKLLSFL